MRVLLALSKTAEESQAGDARKGLTEFQFLGPIGTGNRSPIFEARASSRALQRWLWHVIGSSQVLSAALVAETPPADRLWIAAEWHGRIVVEAAVIDEAKIDERFWRRDDSYQRSDLIIFRRVETPRVEDEDLDLVTEERDTDLPAEPGLFQSHLHDVKPRTSVVRLEQVRDNRQSWFGDLAGEEVGGSIALLSSAFNRFVPGDRRLRIRNPAACGFKWAHGKPTLPYWIGQKKIAATVWGGGVDELDRQRGSEITIPEGVPALAAWGDRDWRFMVTITMTGLEDPDVIFGPGAVFEQPTLNGQQNLAIAHGGKVTVAVQQTLQIALPAWCLNARFRPPSGPLRPTPLSYAHNGSGRQEDVWDEIEELRTKYA